MINGSQFSVVDLGGKVAIFINPIYLNYLRGKAAQYIELYNYARHGFTYRVDMQISPRLDGWPRFGFNLAVNKAETTMISGWSRQ